MNESLKRLAEDLQANDIACNVVGAIARKAKEIDEGALEALVKAAVERNVADAAK